MAKFLAHFALFLIYLFVFRYCRFFRYTSKESTSLTQQH